MLTLLVPRTLFRQFEAHSRWCASLHRFAPHSLRMLAAIIIVQDISIDAIIAIGLLPYRHCHPLCRFVYVSCAAQSLAAAAHFGSQFV